MELEIIKVAGQVAGIGGLAVGAIVLLYRDVIAKNIFPSLTKAQAYSLLKLVVILSWSVAMAGIAAWTYVSVHASQQVGGIGSAVQTSNNYPVIEWVNAAKTAKANKTIHPDRPLPNELVTKRVTFQEWWFNTPLIQKKRTTQKLCMMRYRWHQGFTECKNCKVKRNLQQICGQIMRFHTLNRSRTLSS